MKKVSLVLLSVILLTSCGSSNTNDTGSKLIFTQFQTFSDSVSTVIELYNNSSLDIGLTNHKLVIDRSGVDEDLEFILSGTIKSYDTLTIGYSTNTSILSVIDVKLDFFPYNGTQALSLKKGNKTLDIVGTVDLQYEYGRYLDMCRKQEFLIGRKIYNQYDWIRYACDDISRFNTIDGVVDNETFLEGPHLTEEDFAKDFSHDEDSGAGGVILVNSPSMGDGDTTTFDFGNSLSYLEGRQSVRYIAIDTPEIQHGNYISAQPWGYAAKTYNNDILKRAKAFAIQSVPNYSLRDTYGRLLGYVWISFQENPQPEDFILLNYLIVKEGYSTLRFINGRQQDDKTRYQGISYTNYMRNAEILAQINKIKVHGEVDPNFDYE